MKKRIILSRDGERLYKRVVVKVFTPDGEKHRRIDYRSPKGYGVTLHDLSEELWEVVQQAEEAYKCKYRIVSLPGNQINIVRAESVQ